MKRMPFTWAAMLVVCVFLGIVGCSDDSTEPQPTNQLTGTVTDATGAPVAGAGILVNYRLVRDGRPATGVSFTLPDSSHVTVAIFNDGYADTVITLFDGIMAPGYRLLTWDGVDGEGLIVPAGVYYFIVATEDDIIDGSMAMLYEDYPAAADPADYRFQATTDAEGRFVLEQSGLNFDYPFYGVDAYGDTTVVFTMPRDIRFVAMADGFLTAYSEWAFAGADSGCHLDIQMNPATP